MLLQWSEALEVGHPIIDYDHQMLINLVNELDRAVQMGQGAEKVAQVLDRLSQDIETHFAREEELFEQTAYPLVEKHKQHHRDIEDLVRVFQAAYEENPASIDLNKLLKFLKEWLMKHIGKLDKGYAPYVEKTEQKTDDVQRKGFA